jgi:hypothetical protein
MRRSITTLFVLCLAGLASASISSADFTGSGKIAVLAADDWRDASPKDKVGCLNNHGKLIEDDGKQACGVFTRFDDYPYSLYTNEGNCTFDDQSQEKNTDSIYGGSDPAFNCNATYEAIVYDQFYTIVSLPQHYTKPDTYTHRTASPTSSSALAMSPASTTRRKRPKSTTNSHSGSTIGAPSKWASRPATSR